MAVRFTPMRARRAAGWFVALLLPACDGPPMDVVLGSGPSTGGRAAAASSASGGGSGKFMPFPTMPTGSGGCPTFTMTAERLSQHVYVAVDRSESMNDALPEPAEGTWWTAARDAIVRFAAQPESKGVLFGLQFFPHAAAGVDGCHADYSVPSVPFGTLPEHVPVLQTALDEQAGTGLRPLHHGVFGALLSLAPPWSSKASHRSLVILTRGLITECEPLDDAQLGKDVGAAHALGKVRTHVVGLGASVAEGETLHGIAAQGGTSRATLVSEGDVVDRIHAALGAARLPVDDCRYALPPTPDGLEESTYLSRLTVSLAVSEQGMPLELPRLGGPADCRGPERAGWHVGMDERNSHLVVLCPRTCTEARSRKVIVEQKCRPAVGQ